MGFLRDRVRRLPMQDQDTVTHVELFFDLVFVFALTQITAFMAPSSIGTGCYKGY